MPKKSKKKPGKKSTKKAVVKKVVKKTVKKKSAKKAARRPKKKSAISTRPARATSPVGNTLRTPVICASNFSGKNNDPVDFQNIPQNTTVTLYQISGDTYPFSPYQTDINGLRYTEIQSGDQVTIVVPAINQTYYYEVEGDANCPENNPGHSVTVNS